MNVWNSNLVFILLTFLYFYIFCTPVVAKIEIEELPERIEIGKEFEVKISLGNLSDKNHYLGIYFHKNSGDKYFGQTKNDNHWIEAQDSNCKSFFPADVMEGSWSGKLTGRIIYNEDDFDNTLGNYSIKIAKFTDSCNKSFSDAKIISIFDSNPPPINIPSPTNNPPTITKTKTTLVSPTNKPTLVPTKNPTLVSPTEIIVKHITLFNKSLINEATISGMIEEGEILGEQSSTDSGVLKEVEKKKNYGQTYAMLFIIVGAGFLGAAALSIFLKKKPG